jgi:CheY-like chemotaxis protein
MIYGFARQSGGQVRIYSEPGQGATVCLYLPRHYGDGDERKEAAVSIAPPRADKGETVLIIDDEAAVHMLIAEVLADLGYNAMEAVDGPTAMEILQSDLSIDLLMTDVGLPNGMNGRQIADAARSIRPGLKVMFITGYAENAAIGHGHLEPGMTVITKPFAMDVLAVRIKEMCSD